MGQHLDRWIVDHVILCKTLDLYGLDGTSLNWLQNILKDRLQFVKVNNHLSCSKEVRMGVPQGSIQGLFLFIVYM